MDILFKERLKKGIIIAAVVMCIFMVLLPEETAISSQKALMLWVKNIVPVMLPFFIAVNYITRSGALTFLPPGLFTFFMSMISGYPMGPKIIGNYINAGVISRDYGKWLLSFCTLAGPPFMTAAVGAGMLGAKKAGYIIAIAHYLGALVNMILFRRKGLGNIPVSDSIHREKSCVMNIMTSSITSSFNGIFTILAYIIIFTITTDILIPEWGGILKGLAEMTVGSGWASESEYPLSIKTVLCTFYISFGGLSVAGQSMTMLDKTGINFSYYIKAKILHGIISAAAAFLLCTITEL